MKITKELEAIFFPVEKVKLTDLIKGYEVASPKDYAIIGDIGGTPTILDYRTNQYGLVNNRELIMPLIEGLDTGMHVSEIKVRTHKSAQFFVDFIFDDGKTQVTKGDIIKPTLRWVNSYNGKSRLSISFGAHRVVCSNGLSIPEFGETFKVTHTQSIIERTNEVVAMANEWATKFKLVGQSYKQLADVKVNDIEDGVEAVLEATKFPKAAKEIVMERIAYEIKETKVELNGWSLYNGFNFFLNHHQQNKPNDKVMALDQSVMDFILE